MNRFENHPKYAFIQHISNKSMPVTSSKMAIEAMKDLASLGFDGLMCLDAGYFAWGCGSWLGQAIREFLTQCEELPKRSFRNVVLDMWQCRKHDEHIQLIKSYLLLPVPSYKTKEVLDNGWDKSGFGQVWTELNEEWKQLAFSKGAKELKTAGIDDRFLAYIDSDTFPTSLTAYMGKRLSDEEYRQFIELFDGLSSDKKKKIIDQGLVSRHPFWKRKSQDLYAAK